jgi:serine phosphatase RsbU (regulator of sigma subunit)
MARVALRGLLGKQKETATALAALAGVCDPPVLVEDAEGRRLLGEVHDGQDTRYPVMLDGERLGWVRGGAQGEALAALLGQFVAREHEQRTLGSEVLHLYREVNLIYAFSEKLAALLDVEAVAATTLAQARQLIGASDGVVMIRDEATGALDSVEGFGAAGLHPSSLAAGAGLIGAIAAGGNAEIVNTVSADPRRGHEPAGLRSLVVAPLRVGERVTGAVALGNTAPTVYTAGDLKLLNTLALQAASALENARLFERTVQAARERERLVALHKELEVAAAIQADLFPSALPAVPGYDLAVRNRPARQCGGDYYDALDVTPGSGHEPRVLLCVADVAGKGLPASLLMANTQATLRALARRAPSLVDLAEQANELLHATTSENKYVTAALLELTPSSGSARFVSAGHTNCLLARADGTAEWLASTGLPLGMLPPGLPFGGTDLRIGPGDRLLLFSDGVTEAQDAAGEEFGETRLLDLVRAAGRRSAAAIVTAVFDAIDTFAGDAPQHDDITLLVLERRATEGQP